MIGVRELISFSEHSKYNRCSDFRSTVTCALRLSERTAGLPLILGLHLNLRGDCSYYLPEAGMLSAACANAAVFGPVIAAAAKSLLGASQPGLGFTPRAPCVVFCLVTWAWGTQSGDVPGEAVFWVLATSLCGWDGVKGGPGEMLEPHSAWCFWLL